MNRRAEILQALVRFESDPDLLLSDLRQLGWDWDGEPLAVLRRHDFLSILNRFLSGSLSALQLESWAENLECREDVGFDPADEEFLEDILFRLANPLINEPLTPIVVQHMANALLSTQRA